MGNGQNGSDGRRDERTVLPGLVAVGLGRRRLLDDVYHFMLAASWPRTLSIILALYLTANTAFAGAYFLDEGGIEGARPGSFGDAFFFSVQTMATIGYGRLAPVSATAHVLVTVEALLGLLGLALATGLIFAKFARPTSRVVFSRNLIVAPRDGLPCLTFRVANARTNQIVEATVRVTYLRNEVTAEGERLRRQRDLTLARNSSAVFSLSWTIWHPLAPDSPLQGATPESLQKDDGVFIVSLTGIDETFAQPIHARHIYTWRDVRWNARFVDLFSQRPDGTRVADYAKLHDVVEAPASGEVKAG